MRSKKLNLLLVFGTLAIVGLMLVQGYWFKRAFAARQDIFLQKVHIALRQVYSDLMAANGLPPTALNPVVLQNSGVFRVEVNDVIQPDVLEVFLRQAFRRQDIEMDFAYGLYDCTTNEISFGNFVCLEGDCNQKPAVSYDFSSLPEDNHNFGVYFPKKDVYLASQDHFWIASTTGVLLLCCLYAFSMISLFRQRKLTEMQTDFINHLAHEFNTPLAALAISAEVLHRDDINKFPDRIKQYSSIVQTETERLRNHVKAILKQANSHKISMLIQKAPTDLVALAEGVVFSFKNQVPEANFSIISDQESLWANVDKLHLKNLITNLIENACKYRSQAAPEVKIRLEAQSKNVMIQVEDNGRGIAPKYQKVIFDRFYRIPSLQSTEQKGFGLGLYYVKKVIEAHNGQIKVNSQPGKGSIFYIKIPSSHE